MNDNKRERLIEAIEKKAERERPKLRDAVTRCRFFSVFAPLAAISLIATLLTSFDLENARDNCFFLSGIVYFTITTFYSFRVIKLVQFRDYHSVNNPLKILMASNLCIGLLIFIFLVISLPSSRNFFFAITFSLIGFAKITICWKSYHAFKLAKKENYEIINNSINILPKVTN